MRLHVRNTPVWVQRARLGLGFWVCCDICGYGPYRLEATKRAALTEARQHRRAHAQGWRP
jgi:hypothetical protein